MIPFKSYHYDTKEFQIINRKEEIKSGREKRNAKRKHKAKFKKFGVKDSQ